MVISGNVASGIVSVCKHTFIDDDVLDDLCLFTEDVIQYYGKNINNEILYKGSILQDSLIVRVSKAFFNLLHIEHENFNIFTQILQEVLFNIYYNLSSFINLKRSDYDLKVFIVLDDTLNKKKM